uniref:SXP/RAL-2 family protein Ani s 5-like cation-binding domain-containing protein n=1 Tax=Parascaris univalens TaxID=6257 RepID=A0A915AR91_PARUN
MSLENVGKIHFLKEFDTVFDGAYCYDNVASIAASLHSWVPDFLKNIASDGVDNFCDIVMNENLTKAEAEQELSQWAENQGGEVREQFDNYLEGERQKWNNLQQKMHELIGNVTHFFTEVENLRDDMTLTKREERQNLLDLFAATDRTVLSLAERLGEEASFLVGEHQRGPCPICGPRSPPAPPFRRHRSRFDSGVLEGGFPDDDGFHERGSIGNTEDEIRAGHYPFKFFGVCSRSYRPWQPWLPDFLKNISSEGVREFCNIATNENLTKADSEQQLEQWAQSQGVQEQFKEFMEERKQKLSNIQQKMQELIVNVSRFISELETIHSDTRLTRRDEKEKVLDLVNMTDRAVLALAKKVRAEAGFLSGERVHHSDKALGDLSDSMETLNRADLCGKMAVSHKADLLDRTEIFHRAGLPDKMESLHKAGHPDKTETFHRVGLLDKTESPRRVDLSGQMELSHKAGLPDKTETFHRVGLLDKTDFLN